MSANGHDVEHGTYAAYQWHRRTKTPMCADCALAGNKYRRDHYKRTGGKTDQFWNKTRADAMQILAETHPEEFSQILSRLRLEARRYAAGALSNNRESNLV